MWTIGIETYIIRQLGAHIFASALHVYDLIGVIIITPKLKRNATNVTFLSIQLIYLLSVRNLCLKEGIPVSQLYTYDHYESMQSHFKFRSQE